MGRSYRGMVLAAGLGTRLSPLTDVIPKPMLLIGGERLVESAVRRLTAVGVAEIAVNLHHLGAQISDGLGAGQTLGCSIRYFHEPVLLGTAGGLRNAAEFLGVGPFLVTNSDVVADIELEAALRHHERSGALVTLVLRTRDAAPHSALLLDADDRVADIGGVLGTASAGLREVQFTGTAIYEPGALDLIPPGVTDTPRDLWLPLLRKYGLGVISGWCSNGYFSDVGTWDRLLQTHRERLRPDHPAVHPCVAIREPVHVAESAQVDERAELGPAVTIGPGACVLGHASLSDLIVLPGERVGPGAYRRGVVGHGMFLQPPQERQAGTL